VAENFNFVHGALAGAFCRIAVINDSGKHGAHTYLVDLPLDAPYSRAAAKGWDAAEKSRDWLNDERKFDAIADENSNFKDHFSQCKSKKFKARVDCCHYCPEVDDDGSLKSTSLDWVTCKSE